MEGIKNGFRITDVKDYSQVNSVCLGNHPSVAQNQKRVEHELEDQLEKGNYRLCAEKPTIISPLGAIPKDSNDIRLIHDCSRPVGSSLNDYSMPSPVQYENLEKAYSIARPGWYMGKIDLKSAYRSVAIHPDDYTMTGIQFKFSNNPSSSFLFDVRLPFGAQKGPQIFHRLSQAVKRMMARRGYNEVIAYLDDFFFVAETYERCQEIQRELISLLIKLGFCISWKKVVGPSQRVEFLGVTLDTTTCTASLSEIKMSKLYDKLLWFDSKRRASKRQLQSLAGSLNWACQVVRGGRFFLRRILDCISKLKQMWHKCILSAEFRKDLEWWIQFSRNFNGTIYYAQAEKVFISTDSCNEGCGVFSRGDWQYVNWKRDIPKVSSLHITYQETLAIILGVARFAVQYRNCDIVVVTDSTVAKGIINKGRCKSPYVMNWLREMFWLMTVFNVRVHAIHIPGSLNQIPDAISRLHEPGQVLRLHSLLKSWYHCSDIPFLNMCYENMSPAAFQVVAPHLIKWACRMS